MLTRPMKPLGEDLLYPPATEARQAEAPSPVAEQTSDPKKDRWRTLVRPISLLLVAAIWPTLQFGLGEGAFWRGQPRDAAKEKYRIELYENLTQEVAQALHLNQEHTDACTYRGTSGGRETLRSLSSAERIKMGCQEKEFRLALLNQRIEAKENQLARLEGRAPRNLRVTVLLSPNAST